MTNFKVGDFVKSYYYIFQVVSIGPGNYYYGLLLRVLLDSTYAKIGYEHSFNSSYFTLITDPNEINICEDVLLKINKLRVFS